MKKYYITDSKIKHTEKQGQRVANRMPTNVNKSISPQPILSIINSLNILEKQISYGVDPEYRRREKAAEAIAGLNVQAISPSISSLIGGSKKQKGKIETPTDTLKLPEHSVNINRQENIQNSLDILEKQTIKHDKYKHITGHTTVPDIKIHAPVFEGEHTIPTDILPHTRTETFGTVQRQPEHRLQREAIMQNSENISKEVINPFAVATAKVKEELGNDVSFEEGSEAKERRDTIAEAIKEKEGISISKAILLCKLDKQIIQLENRGIDDEYILKAYGSFDAIPEELRKQEGRPPISWFEKALENMQKSNYTGNAYRYCLELWKSSDIADELIQKAIGVTSVKPLDDDELYERERLVDDTAPGGEAEEIIGDGTKVKTTDVGPVKVTSTN